MGTQPTEERIALIIEAFERASRDDSPAPMPRSGGGDALDHLAEAIENLLKRSRDRASAFQSAQEAVLRLKAAGDAEAGSELTRERVLLMDALKENMPDKIYFKDRDGRFISVSKARATEFSLTSDLDAIGKTDFDYFTEEHARAAREDEQRILSTGEPLMNKEEKETRSGLPATWVLTTKMPLRDSQGAVVGTFGISRDITDRKRAEEALRESEERYRLLFNSIDDAVLVFGISAEGFPGRITEANDAACESLGYSRAELFLMSPFDFDASDVPQAWPERIERLKKEGHAVWEGVNVAKGGSRIPVEVRNHLIDMGGTPMILSAVRDITERKTMGEKLEREKTLLITLIDNLPDYVAVKDRESRILVTNSANALVMGLERAGDAVGKTDSDFYPPEEAERHLEDERTIIRTGMALVDKEEESIGRDGRKRWTLTTKVPLKEAQGRVEGVVCTGRDITSRKEAEELLRASLAEKEMLLREVHHRVKNNLQVISSLVSLQYSSFRDEADRSLGMDMKARIGSMAQLHELLYGSKNLSGIDPAEYLEAIVRGLSLSYGGSPIRVRAQSDIMPIDEAMPFGLIANELLTNALKYAYPPELPGEIDVIYSLAEGWRRLEVRDEGVGLPKGFDPADSASMGFLLVRSLAEQMEGQLSIREAKPGEPRPGLSVSLAFRFPRRPGAFG